MRSTICILIALVLITGCGGGSGGGGGISGTGAGDIYIDLATPAGLTPIPPLSDAAPSDDPVVTPSSSCIRVDPAPPDNLRGMWRSDSSNDFLLLAEDYIFLGNTDVVQFDSRSLGVFDQVFGDNEYFFSFRRSCTESDTNAMIVMAQSDQVLFNATGGFEYNARLVKSLASSFVSPPVWIVGTWEYSSGESIVVREFSETDIILGNAIESIEFTDLLSSDTAIFLTTEKNESSYGYQFILDDVTSGVMVEVEENFSLTGDDKLIYRVTIGPDEYQYEMTRITGP